MVLFVDGGVNKIPDVIEEGVATGEGAGLDAWKNSPPVEVFVGVDATFVASGPVESEAAMEGNEGTVSVKIAAESVGKAKTDVAAGRVRHKLGRGTSSIVVTRAGLAPNFE